MPRKARKKSESGIYHVILRGQNKQTIFEDDEDREKFLQTLESCKSKSEFKIYGYCLMQNHVHLLIQETNEDLGVIMRRLGASYVYWYNRKYKRCGHLFQDRFKSETVETDAYFLTVLRYIHLNTVKVGLPKKMFDYKWSSYCGYTNNVGITDIDLALGFFAEDKNKAVKDFIKYHNEQNEDNCLEAEETIRMSDEEAKEIIKKKCGVPCSLQLKDFDKKDRDTYIKMLKENGLSTRQIERLTGIKRPIILKT